MALAFIRVEESLFLRESLNSARMRGAVFVAIAAAIGNFLQGWDNATIAGIYAHYTCSIY